MPFSLPGPLQQHLQLWQSLMVEALRQERMNMLHANWCFYFYASLCNMHLRCPYGQATTDGGCVHDLALIPFTEAGAVGAAKVKPK